MDIPKFSVIIPTYNRISALRQCLESLSNQSVDKKCIEVIIANDGGDKNLFEGLDFTNRQFPIEYLHLERKGPAGARNSAVKKARGKIIVFLDDDCLPTENWLSAVIKAWERFPKAAGIGGYVTYGPEDNIYCRVNSDLFNWYLGQHSSGEYCTFISTCNAGYRKDIFEEIKGFDEQFKNASGEDRDLNIKILKAGGKLKLDKNALIYHDRALSFGKFVTRYYNYGRAAYRLYIKYPELKQLGAKDYRNFFLTILGKYSNTREKFIAFWLLTASQSSTLIGYFSGMLCVKCKRCV